MIPSYYVKRVTAPSVDPITTDELKTHLKISGTSEDTYLTLLIKAATRDLETYTQRIWCNCELLLALPDFSFRWIELPYAADNTSVVYVKYKDEDGNLTTIDSSNYLVVTEYAPAILKFKSSYSFPAVDLWEGAAVTISYTTGATLAASVPQNFKYALLLYCAFLYENREALPFGVATRNAPVMLPGVVQNILFPHRIHGFLSDVQKGF